MKEIKMSILSDIFFSVSISVHPYPSMAEEQLFFICVNQRNLWMKKNLFSSAFSAPQRLKEITGKMPVPF